MRQTGRISAVKPARGFGFLRLDGSDRDLFFHVSALGGGVRFDASLIGARVSFTAVQSERDGRERATDLRFVPVEAPP